MAPPSWSNGARALGAVALLSPLLGSRSLRKQRAAPAAAWTPGPCAGQRLATRAGAAEHPQPIASGPAGFAQGSRFATGAVAGGLAAAAAGLLAAHRRQARRAYRDGGESRMKNGGESLMKPFKDPAPPKNLYELLRIPSSANESTIKKAYYKMQKICHPDVAGPAGQDMSSLLNKAYDILKDPKTRTVYDENLHAIVPTETEEVKVATDLTPMWEWQPKSHKKKPVWKGVPRSRSRWEKVPMDERGEKHAQEKFVFVNEWQCISCRNCCDVAPQTFCIDVQNGRARVYAQWGNNEEYLDYAVAACPVDCISWVDREELQLLEHVTADKMFEGGDGLPCPMAMRQGLFTATVDDPFGMAESFEKKLKRKEASRKRKMLDGEVAPKTFDSKIAEVFQELAEHLRIAGWGKPAA